MSESMKKNAEMNELLTEAKDMELDKEAGGIILPPINITQRFKCGLILTVSAECRADHKPCR